MYIYIYNYTYVYIYGLRMANGSPYIVLPYIEINIWIPGYIYIYSIFRCLYMTHSACIYTPVYPIGLKKGMHGAHVKYNLNLNYTYTYVTFRNTCVCLTLSARAKVIYKLHF